MKGIGWVALGIPLGVAVFGPLIADDPHSVAAPLLPPSARFPLGTDLLGRDALTLVLCGGGSIVGMTVAALALAYLIGVPLGLFVAGQSRRWLDHAVLRSLDIVLAFPSLLVLMVLAAAGHRGVLVLVCAAALLQLPAVTRIARTAALAPGCRTAVEALRMQGASWSRIQLGYVARAITPPVLTDLGSRLGLVLYLLASANFLGLGLPSSSSDWAVVIERNSRVLFSQPWIVLVPALLLMSLCVGMNLTADRLLAARRVAP